MTVAIRPAARGQSGTILIVEDEIRAQRLLRLDLESSGYRVVTSAQAEGVIELVEANQPDLIVLDLKLPDGDGFELCREIRGEYATPVIILSAFGQPNDKVRGFQLGADDYVTKPYDPAEFVLRIDAVLRRTQERAPRRDMIFRTGDLQIDFTQRLVTLGGEELLLSRTEYRLLEFLALNAGRTLVADVLLSKVWGPEYSGNYASLHLYVSRLRHKLGEGSKKSRYIITKSGIGYMMPAPAPDVALHHS